MKIRLDKSSMIVGNTDLMWTSYICNYEKCCLTSMVPIISIKFSAPNEMDLSSSERK